MPNTDIQRLGELAAQIRERRDGLAVYASPEGDAVGQWLFTVPPDPDNPLCPGGAGQLCRMSAGSSFDVHTHFGCTEILVVLCGILEVTRTGRDAVTMAPGAPLTLPPGEQHSARAVTDCVVIGITIPRDGGYPNGPGEAPAGPAE